MKENDSIPISPSATGPRRHARSRLYILYIPLLHDRQLRFRPRGVMPNRAEPSNDPTCTHLSTHKGKQDGEYARRPSRKRLFVCLFVSPEFWSKIENL